MIPANYKLTYTAEQIHSAVVRLAHEITPWAQQAGAKYTDVIAIPILRGGIYFFSDLTREIESSLELAPVRVKTYLSEVNAAQRNEVTISADGLDVRGRAILLVDDICDSGRTLAVLSSQLQKDGAAEIQSAVLIRRKLDTAAFLPNWVGFEYSGPEWFVGYGMEDRNRFMNLPAIYTIPPGA